MTTHSLGWCDAYSSTKRMNAFFRILLRRIRDDSQSTEVRWKYGVYERTVSIGRRTITNLRFADDIDGLAGEERELAKLVERLDKTSLQPKAWRSAPRRPS